MTTHDLLIRADRAIVELRKAYDFARGERDAMTKEASRYIQRHCDVCEALGDLGIPIPFDPPTAVRKMHKELNELREWKKVHESDAQELTYTRAQRNSATAECNRLVERIRKLRRA